MSSRKLSQKEFNGLQKSALYKIYSDLYDQKEDYRKIIEFIERTSEADKDGKLQSTSTKAKEVSKTEKLFAFSYTRGVCKLNFGFKYKC